MTDEYRTIGDPSFPLLTFVRRKTEGAGFEPREAYQAPTNKLVVLYH